MLGRLNTSLLLARIAAPTIIPCAPAPATLRFAVVFQYRRSPNNDLELLSDSSWPWRMLQQRQGGA